MNEKERAELIKKYSVNTRNFGYGLDEENEIDYSDGDEYQYVEEIESMKNYIDELFPNGGRFVGEYQYSNYRGRELKNIDIFYTNEQLKELLVSEGPRGAIPYFEKGVLTLPMEDLGGGIITSVDLEYKGDK